jgi:hypothetical protein
MNESLNERLRREAEEVRKERIKAAQDMVIDTLIRLEIAALRNNNSISLPPKQNQEDEDRS